MGIFRPVNFGIALTGRRNPMILTKVFYTFQELTILFRIAVARFFKIV